LNSVRFALVLTFFRRALIQKIREKRKLFSSSPDVWGQRWR